MIYYGRQYREVLFQLPSAKDYSTVTWVITLCQNTDVMKKIQDRKGKVQAIFMLTHTTRCGELTKNQINT